MNTMIVPPTIETRIVGVVYEGRQKVVALLTQWEQVFLIREPQNPFDSNAIKVTRWDKQQLGYVNRELAKVLAPRMDRNERFIKATVIALTGGDFPGSSLGAWIKFRMPE